MGRGKQGGSNAARQGNRFISSSRNNSRGKDTNSARAPVNQRLGEFTIERMGHDGRGIANWQGKTLFIEGALRGERVTARLQQDHARYAEAVVESLLIESPERQSPVCAHYYQCGGCQLQHWQPEHQLAFKQATALEQIKRWGGLEPVEVSPAIISPSEGYRGRARLGVWYEKDGSVTLGFRQRQSNQLTPIQDCSVLDASLNALLMPLRQWLTDEHSARAITHVELLLGVQERMVILRHTKIPGERDWQGLRRLQQEWRCTICVDDGSGVLKDLHGQAIDPRLFYYADDAQRPLAWHPQDFTQVNQSVNRRMVAQAIDWLALTGSERVLDLFCGIGNFTLPLAKHCAEVVGVEAVESMVERGRENARRGEVNNARFIAADLTQLSVKQLQQQCGSIDAILLDPPRDGAQDILLNIRQLGARKLVYVSCNPATLARDAAVLAEAGYRLAKLGVMDMFPHTAHVESMALFVLNKK